MAAENGKDGGEVNPWFDKDNPYINLESDKHPTFYCGTHPLSCVVEVPSGRPLYSRDSVDQDIERLDKMSCEYLEIGRVARLFCNYLRWRKWEEEHE